jgi:hypothetical protein
MKDQEGWPVCPHGYSVGLCKECQIAEMQTKKQARKGTPIKALKNRSRDQELKIGKDYKGAGFPHARRVPMSGAISTMPADVDPGELLLVECKQTRTGRMVIDPKWLAQVEKQSIDSGRAGYYALHAWVAAGDEHYHKVVVVDEKLWMQILKQFKEAEVFQELELTAAV